MHTFGKVLTWLMVPLIIAGVVLAGQAVNVRNSWTEKATKLTQENADRALRIEEKEDQLNQLRHERALVTQGWNRTWPGIDVTVTDTNTGVINAQLGVQQGILLPQSEQLPVLHGFLQNADGSSRYIGPFRVDNPQNNVTGMIPVWYPRPEDIASWPVSAKWRFWESVPAEYTNRFTRILDTLTETEEQRDAVLANEKEAVARNQKAKDQIAQRLQELQGGGNPPMQENVAPEVKNGLLATLSAEEQTRNQALKEVDTLRREIHSAQVELDKLLAESRKLVEQLPGATVNTADASSGQ